MNGTQLSDTSLIIETLIQDVNYTLHLKHTF